MLNDLLQLIHTDIIDMVHSLKGNDYLYLQEPVMVKLSPHTPPLGIHGLRVSHSRALYVMDSGGIWHRFEESGLHADKIIASIYKKVKTYDHKICK